MSSAAILDTPGLTPPTRPEPPLDRFGRYIIPDPKTGEKRAWTRATTWAKTIADTHALGRWEQRKVALGLGLRNDLLLSVAAIMDPDSPDGKKKLDKLVDQAKEAAKAQARANIGGALHGLAEAHDLGRDLPAIPPPFDADIEAYRKAMRGVEISKNYVEKICLVRELGVAGTMDRIVRFSQRLLPLIGDIKTGSDLKYSWPEIGIQLALYAHADTIYDPLGERHFPMLKVDQEKALVAHLPAGEGRCTLYLVDIAAGWEMAQLCLTVRSWRTRKDIAGVLNRSER